MPFLSFQTAPALKGCDHCQMGKRLHRQKRKTRINQEVAAFEPCQRSRATSWSRCQGDCRLSQLLQQPATGEGGRGGIWQGNDGWDVGQHERVRRRRVCVFVRWGLREFKCKQHLFKPLHCAVSTPRGFSNCNKLKILHPS